MTKKILFYGDGNSAKGIGHLVRSIGMASSLLEVADAEYDISFATSRHTLAKKIFSEFSVENVPLPRLIKFEEDTSAHDWTGDSSEILNSLLEVQTKEAFDLAILDGKYVWDESQWRSIRSAFPHLVFVDSAEAIAQPTDGVIIPSETFEIQKQMRVASKIYFGNQWIWLHPAIRNARRSSSSEKVFDFAIQMGGGDPQNQTLQALKDLKVKATADDNVIVLCGPSFKFKSQIEAFLSGCNFKWKIGDTTQGFHKLISQSRVLLCAYGLIAREAYYLGVPTVLYAHSVVHKQELDLYATTHPVGAISQAHWMAGGEISKVEVLPPWPNISGSLKSFVEAILNR